MSSILQRNIKLESHYIPVDVKIKEAILARGDELNRSSPVRADHTQWKLHRNSEYSYFIDKFHEIYPKYRINELWGCTVRQLNARLAAGSLGCRVGGGMAMV